MRQQGRLTEWNDERGFGFITPRGSGERIFVHISAFPLDKGRPIAMDLVTYAIDRDDRGRWRAIEVLYLSESRCALTARPGIFRSSPLPVALAISVLLLVLAAIGAV